MQISDLSIRDRDLTLPNSPKPGNIGTQDKIGAKREVVPKARAVEDECTSRGECSPVSSVRCVGLVSRTGVRSGCGTGRQSRKTASEVPSSQRCVGRLILPQRSRRSGVDRPNEDLRECIVALIARTRFKCVSRPRSKCSEIEERTTAASYNVSSTLPCPRTVTISLTMVRKRERFRKNAPPTVFTIASVRCLDSSFMLAFKCNRLGRDVEELMGDVSVISSSLTTAAERVDQHRHLRTESNLTTDTAEHNSRSYLFCSCLPCFKYAILVHSQGHRSDAIRLDRRKKAPAS